MRPLRIPTVGGRVVQMETLGPIFEVDLASETIAIEKMAVKAAIGKRQSKVAGR